MPHFHDPPQHSNQAREKRDVQLRDFDRAALETAYKVSQQLPLDADISGVPDESMVEAILISEFGEID